MTIKSIEVNYSPPDECYVAECGSIKTHGDSECEALSELFTLLADFARHNDLSGCFADGNLF